MNIYTLKLPPTTASTIAGLRQEIDSLKRMIEELVSAGGDEQYRIVNAYMPEIRKHYKRERVEQEYAIKNPKTGQLEPMPPRPLRIDGKIGRPEWGENPKIVDHEKLRNVA